MAILAAQIVSMIALGLVTWLVGVSSFHKIFQQLFYSSTVSQSAPSSIQPVIKLFKWDSKGGGHLCKDTLTSEELQGYCVSSDDKSAKLSLNLNLGFNPFEHAAS